MALAAKLAQPAKDPPVSLTIFDTLGRPEGARTAAAAAVRDGAQLILGPVFGPDVVPALNGAGGRAPLVAFTNNGALVGRGAFIFGITPAQSIGIILRYARGQGVRLVAVVAQPDELGRQAAEAARRTARETGMTLAPPVFHREGGDGRTLVSEVRAASGGRLPDAVLLPDGGRSLAGFAAALRSAGMQLLGTDQWWGRNLTASAALHGAWLAGPDPDDFAPLTRAYHARQGTSPGLLAGLAFDAVAMAQTLATGSALNREGLTRPAGFSGIAGNFRLRNDGSCVRDLAVLAVRADGVQRIARIRAV